MGGIDARRDRAHGRLGDHARARRTDARRRAEALEARTGVPFTLFDRLTRPRRKRPSDRGSLREHLPASRSRRNTGASAASWWTRCSTRIFTSAASSIAIGAEPDLLWSMSAFLTEMGSQITAAVTTTASPLLAQMPDGRGADRRPRRSRGRASAGCDLLITHSHGRQAAERLNIPLYRLGFPMFDRLGRRAPAFRSAIAARAI